MNSLVSIIIPAYNAERTIKESLESLINQKYHYIEIIVIDDGSIDKTYEIASEISMRDQRIKVYRIENNGVSNARNVGISYSSGNYIAFMDSDDQMESSMIDKMVSLMEDDIDIVCCGFKVVSDKNEIMFEQSPKRICTEKSMTYLAIEELQKCDCMNVIWNKLFRSSIIKDNHLTMDVSISMGEDFLFVLDYLIQMNGRMKVIPDTEYRYTLSPNGLQAGFDKGIELRTSQFNRLKQFYHLNRYPINGVYIEALRTIYIIILENDNTKDGIKNTLCNPICKEVCSTKIDCSGKFKLFYYILKTHNTTVLLICIKLFKKIKRIMGKSYEW